MALLLTTRTADAGQPIILFIFADDQCFATIAEMGNDEIETPNLDRLARSGTTFTYAYNMGSWSGAVCVASRTCRTPAGFSGSPTKLYGSLKRNGEGRFWSEYLKRAGYETYMTGKWHLQANAEKAFDHAVHVRGGMPNQTPAGRDCDLRSGLR